MKKPPVPVVAVLAVTALGLALALPAASAERKLARKDVPAPVLAAFAKAWPGAKALAFAEETEKGKTFYEVESRDGDTARDVLFAPDGTVVEVEETVKEADLPAAVTAAIGKMGPGVTIRKAEKVTKGNAVTYGLTLKGAKVKEVSLDAAGAPARP